MQPSFMLRFHNPSYANKKNSIFCQSIDKSDQSQKCQLFVFFVSIYDSSMIQYYPKYNHEDQYEQLQAMQLFLAFFFLFSNILAKEMIPIDNQYLKYVEVGHNNLVRQRSFSHKLQDANQIYTIHYRKGFKELPDVGICIFDLLINAQPNNLNDFGFSLTFEYIEKRLFYFKIQAFYFTGFVQKIGIKYIAVKNQFAPNQPFYIQQSSYQITVSWLPKNQILEQLIYVKNMLAVKKIKYLYFIRGFNIFQKYRMPSDAQKVDIEVINATYGTIYYKAKQKSKYVTAFQLQLTWIFYTQAVSQQTSFKVEVFKLNNFTQVYSELSQAFFQSNSAFIGLSSLNTSEWMVSVNIDISIPNRISMESLNAIPNFDISFFAFLSTCDNQTAYFSDNTHQCYEKCPLKYYQHQETYSCIRCPYDCISCNQKGSCLSCDKDNLFRQLNNVTQRCQPIKGYFDNGSQMCVKCQNGCQTCTSTTCLKCWPKYFMGLDHLCYLQCPNGTFNSKLSMQCKRCKLDCFTCENDSSCLSCKEQYFRQLDVASRRCLAKEGYFDEGHLQCSKCPTGCRNCSSLTVCFSCQSRYYLNDSKCLMCSLGCENCPSKDTCKKCIKDYYLNYNQCISQCPKGFYSSQEEKICRSCPLNCPSCNQSSKCQEKYMADAITALIGFVLLLVSFILYHQQCIISFRKTSAKKIEQKLGSSNQGNSQRQITIYQRRFFDLSVNQTDLQISSPDKLLEAGLPPAIQQLERKQEYSFNINQLITQQNLEQDEFAFQEFQLQRNHSQDLLQSKEQKNKKIMNTEGNQDCVICDQRNRNMIIETNCTFGIHRFHMFCLMKWAKLHDSCPVCRDPLWQYDHKLLCKQCKITHLLNLYVIQKLYSQEIVLKQGCYKCIDFSQP